MFSEMLLPRTQNIDPNLFDDELLVAAGPVANFVDCDRSNHWLSPPGALTLGRPPPSIVPRGGGGQDDTGVNKSRAQTSSNFIDHYGRGFQHFP